MHKLIKRSGYGVAIMLLAAQAAYAHHSYAMFDSRKSVTYSAVVSVWENKNPHALMWVYINDAKGKPQLWGLEGPSPRILLQNGLDKYAVKPGDKITVTINPLKDGRNGGNLEKIVLANGKTIDIGKIPSDEVFKK